jgi:alkaline phosphatase
MYGMKPNRLVVVIVLFLLLGLTGSVYLYYDTKSDLYEALVENNQIASDLLILKESYNQLLEQIKELVDSNVELESRIEELEAEEDEPPVIVEMTDVVLEITGEGDVQNLILFIGDGMGVGQLTAAEIENGDSLLAITSLPYKSLISTHSSSNYVTDSAASATALATGYKTNNRMVAMSPEGEFFTTVVEVAETLNMSTGVVTTTSVTDATPASFMVHVNNRDHEPLIAELILESGVDVVLGGGSSSFSLLDPSGAGYTLVETVNDLIKVESGKVLGLFSSNDMGFDSARNSDIEPSIAEMTRKSIELLSDDPEGFFLMVEGGRIDHASHENDFDNTITEIFAFDLAVLEALEYASMRNDTLVIVTADHETGGLLIIGGYSSSEVRYDWTSEQHTGSLVPVFAYGPKAEEVLAFSDNTDIGKFLLAVIQ